MTLEVTPEQVARHARHRERVKAAIESADPQKLVRALTDRSIERTEYRIGRRYRLAVIGTPPVEVEQAIPEKGDSIHEQVAKLSGFDARATAAQMGPLELSAVYRGRMQMVGQPHAFRMNDGNDALLHDMDILASERVT